jgi:hypothetical protein
MKPKSKSPSFTMRPKTRTIDKTMSIEPQNINPGAGRYENPEAFSPTGRYSVSKNRNSGATLFNPKRSIRFFDFSKLSIYLENVNPGPGNYESVNLLSDRGRYPVTSTQGYGKRVFDKETRENMFDFTARKNYSNFYHYCRSWTGFLPLPI